MIPYRRDSSLALHACGILAVDRGELRGFVTGLDFARYLAPA